MRLSYSEARNLEVGKVMPGARMVAAALVVLVGCGGGSDLEPTAEIQRPFNQETFKIGEKVCFEGEGTNGAGGELDAAALSWESSIDGSIGDGNEFCTSKLSAGVHAIDLVATNSNGLTSTDTRAIAVIDSGAGVYISNGVGCDDDSDVTFEAEIEGTLLSVTGFTRSEDTVVLPLGQYAYTAELSGCLGQVTPFSGTLMLDEVMGCYVISAGYDSIADDVYVDAHLTSATENCDFWPN